MQIPSHGPNESEIRSLAFSALDFTIRKIGQQGWISNKKLKTVKGGSTVRFIYIYEVYTRTHARLQYIYIYVLQPNEAHVASTGLSYASTLSPSYTRT